MAVTKALANCSQTDSTIHQFCRMAMAQLVQCAGYACQSCVMLPALLHALIAQGAATPILLCLEQRPVFVIK